MVVLRVSRVSSFSRVSTVTLLLRDSIPGLNLPLYYFTGFQEFQEFLEIEGFQMFRRYTLVEGFMILGILESSQCIKCFEGFKGFEGFNAFVVF